MSRNSEQHSPSLTVEDVRRIFGYTSSEELDAHLRNCPRHYIRGYYAEIYLGSSHKVAEIKSNNDKYLLNQIIRAVQPAGLLVKPGKERRKKKAELVSQNSPDVHKDGQGGSSELEAHSPPKIYPSKLAPKNVIQITATASIQEQPGRSLPKGMTHPSSQCSAPLYSGSESLSSRQTTWNKLRHISHLAAANAAWMSQQARAPAALPPSWTVGMMVHPQLQGRLLPGSYPHGRFFTQQGQMRHSFRHHLPMSPFMTPPMSWASREAGIQGPERFEMHGADWEKEPACSGGDARQEHPREQSEGLPSMRSFVGRPLQCSREPWLMGTVVERPDSVTAPMMSHLPLSSRQPHPRDSLDQQRQHSRLSGFTSCPSPVLESPIPVRPTPVNAMAELKLESEKGEESTSQKLDRTPLFSRMEAFEELWNPRPEDTKPPSRVSADSRSAHRPHKQFPRRRHSSNEVHSSRHDRNRQGFRKIRHQRLSRSASPSAIDESQQSPLETRSLSDPHRGLHAFTPAMKIHGHETRPWCEDRLLALLQAAEAIEMRG